MKDHYRVARINKDRRFDGTFYFAVKTTGIFCRPSCPSPVANEKNVEYYESVFEAIKEGYRPCLRCRPDIYTEKTGYHVEGNKLVAKAFKMIENGFLNDHTVEELSETLNISERQLRKLFTEEIGISPVKVAKYHRAVFAKKLLAESELSITDIAFVSGFGSIRQFNDVFKEYFGLNPTQFKKKGDLTPKNVNMMYLPYTSPYNFEEMLAFMQPRLIEGVEYIENGAYVRSFKIKNVKGYFRVSNDSSKQRLALEVFTDSLLIYGEIHHRIRRMFDVDLNSEKVRNHFEGDSFISNLKIPRLPVAFDAYEFAIRAILGQKLSVKSATMLAGKIVKKANLKYECNDKKLTHIFPSLDEIYALELDDVGITKGKRDAIINMNQHLMEGSLGFSYIQSYEDFVEEFTRVKGIGDRTANYVAMRGLGMLDAFPAGDLLIKKVMKRREGLTKEKDILLRAEKWRPYRSYATLCLWKMEDDNVL